LAKTAAVLAGGGVPLVVAPTGSGKTILAVAMIAANPGRSLFLAPRRELVHQTVEKLEAAGIHAGIIMAGEDPNAYRKVQVASIQTLYSRLKRGVLMPSASLVIVDEAHLSISPSTLAVLSHYTEAYRVGLTATPARGDGRALGMVYSEIVEVTTVRDLTEAGFLAPAVYYAPSKPDLRHVKVDAKTRDYVPSQLSKAVDRPELVGDIVQHWHKLAAGRRTVVFASSIEHSQHLANEFNRSGVPAEHVDAVTPQVERTKIFDRFRSGETQILTNCFLASYGFDLPDLSCVVLARPTKSLVLYLQMIGRGLRPAPGKDDCLILDHAGAVHEHGFADFPHDWSIDGEMTVSERAESKRKKTGESKPHTCGQCSHVFRGQMICPKCGWVLPRKATPVAVVDGDLERVRGERVRDNRRIYAELRMYAFSRNYQNGWAAHKYRAIFGDFPPWAWNGDKLLVPSAETVGLIKHLQIKWAKARAKEQRAAFSAT
jgi:superfamily II DNA or RNA helicase